MSSAQVRLYEPVTFVELLADGSLSTFARQFPEPSFLNLPMFELS